MSNIAILGHATRGKEVIELLEMMGGNYQYKFVADCDCFCFYIDNVTKIIFYDWDYNFDEEDATIFTLEEFLEKFLIKLEIR